MRKWVAILNLDSGDLKRQSNLFEVDLYRTDCRGFNLKNTTRGDNMRCNQRTGWAFVIAVAAITWLASPAFAQGGSWGSSHGGSWGSGGSYGCSGGLFGGRRPVRNLLGRIGDRLFNGGSYGSNGCFGSRGASFGSYGSCGHGSTGYTCTGSRLGSWGSRYTSTYSTYCPPTMPATYAPTLGVTSNACAPCQTGTVIGSPVMSGNVVPGSTTFPMDGTPIQGNIVPNYLEQPVPGSGFDLTPGGAAPTVPDTNPVSPTPSNGAPEVGAGGQQTRAERPDESVLVLNVPMEAVVYINGQRTRTEGTLRKYVARKMDLKTEYRYDVDVQIEKDGQKISRKDSVVLKPGKEHRLAFLFRPTTTVLTVDVPKGAEVELCGCKTTSTGSHRRFTTRELVEGETWKDYTVKVKYLKDGLVMTKDRKLDIKAGDSRHLIFNFDEVAAK